MKSVRKTHINADEDGTRALITNRREILKTTKNFYRQLYAHKQPAPNSLKDSLKEKIINVGSEDITEEELVSNIRAMKNDKAPGIDRVFAEFIKEESETTPKQLQTLKITALVR